MEVMLNKSETCHRWIKCVIIYNINLIFGPNQLKLVNPFTYHDFGPYKKHFLHEFLFSKNVTASPCASDNLFSLVS
jgi:hypothetical protein